ncbi:hypothetical protein [Streptomyces sp. NPDC056401]|uniref:hypothetical protein n=1 Tax=Streptomyces sp. NPDC056401 TaxID=3345809 RepID=UPI0035D6EE29
MNTRSISGAAKVICARMGRPNAVGATIAVALDAGGWLNTEDTAAELVRLRDRVAELEAERAPRPCGRELSTGRPCPDHPRPEPLTGTVRTLARMAETQQMAAADGTP